MIRLLYDYNKESKELACSCIEEYIPLLDTSVVEFIKTVVTNAPYSLYPPDLCGFLGYFLLRVFDNQKNLYGVIYNDEKWQSWERFDDYWLDKDHTFTDRCVENMWYQLYLDNNGGDVGGGVTFDSTYVAPVDYYTESGYGHPNGAAFINYPTPMTALTNEQKDMYTCFPLTKKDGGVKVSDGIKHFTFKNGVIREDGMYSPKANSSGIRAVQTEDSRIIRSGIGYIPCNKIPRARNIVLCSVYPKNIAEKYGYPIKE